MAKLFLWCALGAAAVGTAACATRDGGAAVGRIVLAQTTTASVLRVRVYDGTGAAISCATPAASLDQRAPLVSVLLPLETRTGRIDNIPAGENRVFWFEALTGTAPRSVVALGCKDGVKIDGGAVKDLGLVVLNPAPGTLLAFAPSPANASVGDTIRLIGQGFPNDGTCVGVFFAGKDSTGTTSLKNARVLAASPTEVVTVVPTGALSGFIQAVVRTPCANPALAATSATRLRVTPVVRSIAYAPALCAAGEPSTGGGRSGELVELRGTGFSPKASENLVQVTGFPAFRAVWAAGEQVMGADVVDQLRFVVPRGLPAGAIPLSVGVGSAEDEPSLSAPVTFRALPTLREVRPAFAPAGGTVHLDLDGASPDESANLITFRHGSGMAAGSALTFPTLVSGGDLSVLVPQGAGSGTVNAVVAEQCSNERPFFRANLLQGDPTEIIIPTGRAPAPDDDASLVVSPDGARVAGVLGSQNGNVTAHALGEAPHVFKLGSPAGPVFSADSAAAFFLERDRNQLVKFDFATNLFGDVALQPALNPLLADSPLVRRGRFLYVATSGGGLGGAPDLVRIDPVTMTTQSLFGAAGLCQSPPSAVTLTNPARVFAAPSADLLTIVESAASVPTRAILVLDSGKPSGCVVGVVDAPAPAATVAFDPLAPLVYLGERGGTSLRAASFVQEILVNNEVRTTFRVATLPAVLPATPRRLVVAPDGRRLFSIADPSGPVAGGVDDVLGRPLDVAAVDLAQGGTLVHLTEDARRGFGVVSATAVQVSADSKTLYVPAEAARGDLQSSLYHVDLDAFLADTGGTGVGVSSITYGAPGVARASALTPDGATLLILAADDRRDNVLRAARFYSFAQRPRGPFRTTTFSEEVHLDAAFTPDEQRLLTVVPTRTDAVLRTYTVGTWDAASGGDVPLVGFRSAPRIFVSPAHDAAVVVEAVAEGAADAATGRVCIVKNLSQGPSACTLVADAGPAQRVEFVGPWALLNARGGTVVTLVNMTVPTPVPVKIVLARPLTDAFAIGAQYALLLHRPAGQGTAEVTLLDIPSRMAVARAALSGTPGLAALDPSGTRLLVPLVDSPFVDLVTPRASRIEVTRLSTFGGIHLAAAFVPRVDAVAPAARLSALAFDVLRDNLTRFLFEDDRILPTGGTAPGYSVASGTLPIDRSARGGLTDADFQMIARTTADRISPQVLAADGRTLWVNTGEHSEVVAVDALEANVSVRVPLPGSAPQPRQLLPTRDGKWLVIRDTRTGLLQVVKVVR